MPKVLKCACAPSVTTAERDVEAPRGCPRPDATWSSRRAVADRSDQGVVDLIDLRALGADVAFDQRRAGVLADPDQRAREHRRRLCAAGDMTRYAAGCVEHGAVGDLDHHAIASSSRCSAPPWHWRYRARTICRSACAASPASQRLAQRADAEALFQVAPVSESFGANAPSTSTSRRAPVDRMQLQRRAPRAFSAACIRRGRPAAAPRASARADRCISSPRSRRCGRPARS